jgi:conjugal transfer pilus assembly protein TraE
MRFGKYSSEIDNKSAEIKFMRMLLVGLLVVMAIMAGSITKLMASQKTTIVPPEIHRSFWVSDEAVSKEYLEDMAYFYLGLALNITPQTGSYQNEIFLKYAAPADVGRLRTEMAEKADFLRKNNVSTQFAVEGIEPDIGTLRVSFTGVLHTYVGDRSAESRRAAYMVGFKFINGRLSVSDLIEVAPGDPFGDKAEVKAEADAAAIAAGKEPTK